MTAPHVTVLLAVHNGERHLRASIRSVLAQTFEDFELLVVDDASTDGTREILDAFAEPRMRILTNTENLGLTRSLNRGLREARGRYVARQDADDLSDPPRLARQVALLERRPELALVATQYRRIDDSGEVESAREVPTEAVDIRWRLLFLNAFTHSSVTFRRDVVLALSGYDETYSYAQDYDLWSRIAATHEVAALPESLVCYRRTADSMTATSGRAADEVAAIRTRNLEAVGVDARAIDVDVAWRLLFARDGDIDASRATTVARQVLKVQESFARGLGLDGGAARRHRASVGRILAGRLVRLGLRQSSARAVGVGASIGVAAVRDGVLRPTQRR